MTDEKHLVYQAPQHWLTAFIDLPSYRTSSLSEKVCICIRNYFELLSFELLHQHNFILALWTRTSAEKNAFYAYETRVWKELKAYGSELTTVLASKFALLAPTDASDRPEVLLVVDPDQFSFVTDADQKRAMKDTEKAAVAQLVRLIAQAGGCTSLHVMPTRRYVSQQPWRSALPPIPAAITVALRESMPPFDFDALRRHESSLAVQTVATATLQTSKEQAAKPNPSTLLETHPSSVLCGEVAVLSLTPKPLFTSTNKKKQSKKIRLPTLEGIASNEQKTNLTSSHSIPSVPASLSQAKHLVVSIPQSTALRDVDSPSLRTQVTLEAKSSTETRVRDIFVSHPAISASSVSSKRTHTFPINTK
jgi:hypothetical protein